MKDSVEHNYYGDEEKITEEDFTLAKALDHKSLKLLTLVKVRLCHGIVRDT